VLGETSIEHDRLVYVSAREQILLRGGEYMLGSGTDPLRERGEDLYVETEDLRGRLT
jgi:hypothetical protein